MDVNKHARQKSVYEILPLLAKLSTWDMEEQFPEFCRHLFAYALEKIVEFEVDDSERVNEASQAIGSHLIEAIRSVTDAKYLLEGQREQYLNTWIEALFKVLLPDYKSELQRLFKPLKNDLSEEQLHIIEGLGLFNPRARKPSAEEEKEIEQLKGLCHSSGAAARAVIDAMARVAIDKKASHRVLLMWSVMNFPAAVLAISIYFEALALAVQIQAMREPPDKKLPLLVIYLWRKLEVRKRIPAVEARLRFGKGFNSPDSLYNQALNLFRGENPADQEMAADSYCDAFINGLGKLPAEALLNPKLAISYLSKSSKREAVRRLPRQKIELVDPSGLISIVEPSELIAVDEHQGILLEEQPSLPEEFKSLRDFELFKYRAIEKSPLAEIGRNKALTGRERNITRQAVHKRLARFKKRINKQQSESSKEISKQLSDEEWKSIKPLLPTLENKSKRGGRRKDDRRIMGLVLYKMRTGCSWNLLPKARTLLDRYNEWHNAGVFTQMKHSGILLELGITSLPPRRKNK